MNLGSIYFLVLAILALGGWIYNSKIHPLVKTRPPVKKILDLVSRQDGFSIDDNPADTSCDFVLHDTVVGTKTSIMRNCFSGHILFKGEFDWMNQFERKRLYDVLFRIHKDRVSKYKEACRIEKKASDERAREAAIKIYENR